eukprot:gene11513-8197_t
MRKYVIMLFFCQFCTAQRMLDSVVVLRGDKIFFRQSFPTVGVLNSVYLAYNG